MGHRIPAQNKILKVANYCWNPVGLVTEQCRAPAPSHGQTAVSGSESRAVSSRHPRGREHWDNWGPTGASSGMPSPGFQASSLPLLFALRGGHVPLSRHPWPSMRFLGASVPQLGAGGVCRHRALA